MVSRSAIELTSWEQQGHPYQALGMSHLLRAPRTATTPPHRNGGQV